MTSSEPKLHIERYAIYKRPSGWEFGIDNCPFLIMFFIHFHFYSYLYRVVPILLWNFEVDYYRCQRNRSRDPSDSGERVSTRLSLTERITWIIQKLHVGIWYALNVLKFRAHLCFCYVVENVGRRTRSSYHRIKYNQIKEKLLYYTFLRQWLCVTPNHS